MKLRYMLPLLCAFLFCTNVYSVNSTVIAEQTQLIGKSTKNSKNKTWFAKTTSKVKRSFSAIRAGILDSPKRILIYAGIALAAGIVFTLVASVIGVAVIGTLSWLFYIASFALFILFLYTILLR